MLICAQDGDGMWLVCHQDRCSGDKTSSTRLGVWPQPPRWEVRHSLVEWRTDWRTPPAEGAAHTCPSVLRHFSATAGCGRLPCGRTSRAAGRSKCRTGVHGFPDFVLRLNAGAHIVHLLRIMLHSPMHGWMAAASLRMWIDSLPLFLWEDIVKLSLCRAV